MKKSKVYDTILQIGKNIAKEKKGALFVLGPKSGFRKTYEPLFPQILHNHSISEKGMKEVVEKLAILDGAILLTHQGTLIANNVRLKRSKTVPGFGTKHAAAAGITASVKNSTAVLISEEIHWIKIFQNGKIILELDPATQTPKRIHNKIISFITKKDTALLTAAGASAALLGLGPTLVIGGTYLIVKTATGIIRKKFS